MTCSTCRFYAPVVLGDGPNVQCRRYPPVLVVVCDEPLMIRPQVEPHDWCGEYIEAD